MIKRVSLVLISTFLMLSNLNAAQAPQAALVVTQALKNKK